MKKWIMVLVGLLAALIPAEAEQVNWNGNTPIDEVTAYPGFGDWGRLIFPADEGYYSGSTLKDLRLTWYSNLQPAKTVEIVNTLRAKVNGGESVFLDIYTEQEKAADAAKRKGVPRPVPRVRAPRVRAGHGNRRGGMAGQRDRLLGAANALTKRENGGEIHAVQ